MKDYTKIVLLTVFIISLVFMYKSILSYLEIPPNRDPLIHNFFDNNMDLNGWSVTHFIVFAIAGYYGHKHIICLLFVGIMWEITEVYLYFMNKNLTDNHPDWWYGSYSDIIVDFLGLMTGKYIIRKYI
tara:strand:+ start:897 stop:1280 length:384 start_codon:yes stop_codon:yes gene_type:complete